MMVQQELDIIMFTYWRLYIAYGRGKIILRRTKLWHQFAGLILQIGHLVLDYIAALITLDEKMIIP